MADLSAEIDVFRNAIYGEDVREALISLVLKMNSRSIGTNDLVDAAVTSIKIANGAVTNPKLAADSVTRSKILDGEVITSKLASASVTEDKLGGAAVTSGKIANGAITVGKLATDSVSQWKIQDDAVITSKLADSAVTNPKLAADSVTRSKILDGEVITSKLASASVTEDKLGGAAVTSGKIANNSISQWKIQDDAVVTSKLADGAVTESKLDDSLKRTLIPTRIVTPEQYGAVGDGVADDTAAIVAAIKTNRIVNFGVRKKYLVTGVTIENVYNVIIYGNNSTLVMPYSESNDKTILGFVHCTFIDVHNLRITTDLADDLGTESTNIAELFSYAPYGISMIDGCASIRILECAVGLVKDGISANDSNRILISHCYVRNIGQEPIAIRNTDGVIIDGNDLAWHTGDGILIKAYANDRFYDIIVTNNRLCYPKQTTPSALGSLIMGGGITINAENTSDAYLTKGVIITGNQISGCRYGIQLANVGYAIVSNNVVRVNKRRNQGTYDTGSTAFGLTLNPEWAPSDPQTITKVLFANNVGSGGLSVFKCHNDTTDVPCEHIVFSNNVAEGTDLAQSRYGFDVNNATVIGNLVSNCRRNGIFINSVVIGNQFLSPWGTPTNLDESDCCFSGEKCIFNDNVVEGTQIYINCSERSIVRNNYFELSRNDGIVVNCDDQSYSTIMGNDYGNHPLRSENINDMSSVTGHVYTD